MKLFQRLWIFNLEFDVRTFHLYVFHPQNFASPSFLFISEKLSKFPELRICAQDTWRDRTELRLSIGFIFSILDQEYRIFGNERRSTVPTQAMTRAKTVNLDINQHNVSVCCVYSRTSRREILHSPMILPTSARTFVKLVRKTSM